MQKELFETIILNLDKAEEFGAIAELTTIELKHNPRNLFALDMHTKALYKEKRFKEAQASAIAMLQVNNSPETRMNAAKCFFYSKLTRISRDLITDVYNADPFNPETTLDYSLYLSTLGEFDEAFKTLKKVEHLNNNRVSYNLGWHYIRLGEFKKGFDYIAQGIKERVWGSEYRLNIKGTRYAPGMSLKGKRLLLLNEGGMGDEIMFARFGQITKRRGAYNIMAADKSLVQTFSRCTFLDEVIPHEKMNDVQYDCYLPMMNSMSLLNLSDPSGDIEFPYIAPPKDLVSRCRFKINDFYSPDTTDTSIKFGIRWSGNPEFEHDQFRSIDPMLFMPFKRFGKLFSFQRDHDIMAFPDLYPGSVCDLSQHLTSWDLTLAFMQCMDHFMTSCTSLAHARLAMGLPTCVIVPKMSYFPWAGSDRLRHFVEDENFERTSAWYPDAIVFKQKIHGHFEETMVNVFEYFNRSRQK